VETPIVLGTESVLNRSLLMVSSVPVVRPVRIS